MTITADKLNDIAEFDHVFVVHEGGDVTDANNIYAPSVYIDCDDDGQMIDGPDIEGDDWSFVDGYSGQYRYSGPIMHQSEFLGGRMAKDVLNEPGIYVVCEVIDPSDDDSANSDPVGWVLLKRDHVEPRMDRNDNGSWYCNDCRKIVILFDNDEHDCEVTHTTSQVHGQEET